VLTEAEKEDLRSFFGRLARHLVRVLVPGAHVFRRDEPAGVASGVRPVHRAGFEKRGEIIRLVQTLRGGDRPKNAEHEFDMVSVMPRSGWEPWGLFRKPCDGRVQDNLRKWRTGGLRRLSADEPFKDVIEVAPARGREREIAAHPSLKPQALMRQLVRAALPFGEGRILDPFMGSGSTIAAASACGLSAVGLESSLEYFDMAVTAVPKLAQLKVNGDTDGEHGGLRPVGEAATRT